MTDQGRMLDIVRSQAERGGYTLPKEVLRLVEEVEESRALKRTLVELLDEWDEDLDMSCFECGGSIRDCLHGKLLAVAIADLRDLA